MFAPSPNIPKLDVLQTPADLGLMTNFVLWVDEPDDFPPPQRLMPVSTKRHARALVEEAKPERQPEEQPRQVERRLEDQASASLASEGSPAHTVVQGGDSIPSIRSGTEWMGLGTCPLLALPEQVRGQGASKSGLGQISPLRPPMNHQ